MKKVFVFLMVISSILFIACEKNPAEEKHPTDEQEQNEPTKPDQEPEIDNGLGTENGYEYIDLGLSVRWATCNVGAKKPEDYGYYFAWGEVKPKTTYNWETYKYCDGSSTSLTKYCGEYYYGKNGFMDVKSVLDPEDDAAHVNMKGKWRIPTEEEWQELIRFCDCEVTMQNRVSGCKLTSTVEGYTDRSIFLPAAGYNKEVNVGLEGYYWSNSCCYDDDAIYYSINLDREEIIYRNTKDKAFGLSVRPVCDLTHDNNSDNNSDNNGNDSPISTIPSTISNGYTGQVTIVFDPSKGNRGMIGATACYAHTGLITSDSQNGNDWRYANQTWRGGESKYKMIKSGSVWKLIIPNIYDFYGCPKSVTILKLAFVFNDGPNGEKEGKTAEEGDIFVELVN